MAQPSCVRQEFLSTFSLNRVHGAICLIAACLIGNLSYEQRSPLPRRLAVGLCFETSVLVDSAELAFLARSCLRTEHEVLLPLRQSSYEHSTVLLPSHHLVRCQLEVQLSRGRTSPSRATDVDLPSLRAPYFSWKFEGFVDLRGA